MVHLTHVIAQLGATLIETVGQVPPRSREERVHDGRPSGGEGPRIRRRCCRGIIPHLALKGGPTGFLLLPRDGGELGLMLLTTELLLRHLEGEYLLRREHMAMHDNLPSGHLRPLHGLGQLLEGLVVLGL